ncbi:hypothetical protein D3C75_1100790 [compost metagenome]
MLDRVADDHFGLYPPARKEGGSGIPLCLLPIPHLLGKPHLTQVAFPRIKGGSQYGMVCVQTHRFRHTKWFPVQIINSISRKFQPHHTVKNS